MRCAYLPKLVHYTIDNFFNLLSAQVELSSVSKHGRRWSDSVKQLALNLYLHGPKVYRLLSRVMELPTERSLRSKLKRLAENWQIEDRVCSIIFDKISLRRHLQYDVKHDIVIGFQDHGTERSKDVGTTALLMVLSGS